MIQRCTRAGREAKVAVQSLFCQNFSTSLRVRGSSSRSKGSSSSSSSKWLQRQKRDPYVQSRSHEHKARSMGLPHRGDDASSSASSLGGEYVSRAAFKLWQLEEKHHFLVPRKRDLRGSSKDAAVGDPLASTRIIVDLGAAPGGWTQMAWEIVRRKAGSGNQPGGADAEKTRIFALDLLPLDPRVAALPGVDFLQGDFESQDLQVKLSERIKAWGGSLSSSAKRGESEQTALESQGSAPKADVVLSDMMANTSGSTLRTATMSLDLVRMAFNFAQSHLNPVPRSAFVAKVFQGPDADEWRKTFLEPRFHRCKTEKVEGSRTSSSEVYWVCRGFKGGEAVAV
ncbi:unnamed protein product [Parajaminaea phylloscopi]